MNIDKEQAIKELLACEKQRCKALGDEDITTLRKLLAVNLTHNHATGKVDDLENYLDYITKGIKFFDVSRTDDLTVEIIDDNKATMSGTLINIAQMRFKIEEEPMRLESKAVQEWVKNNGQWQVETFTAIKKA